MNLAGVLYNLDLYVSIGSQTNEGGVRDPQCRLLFELNGVVVRLDPLLAVLRVRSTGDNNIDALVRIEHNTVCTSGESDVLVGLVLDKDGGDRHTGLGMETYPGDKRCNQGTEGLRGETRRHLRHVRRKTGGYPGNAQVCPRGTGNDPPR